VSSEVTVDRLQFTLTITYHYLFPILTMGLALFMSVLFLMLIVRIVGRGPDDGADEPKRAGAEPGPAGAV
jgi:hypothetical protein